MTNNELFLALEMMEKEKGIPAQYLAEKIASAIAVAAKHDYGNNDIVVCNIDCDKREFEVCVRKLVVSELSDPYTEILPSEAEQYGSAEVGDYVQIPLDTMKFGRIVAQTAKNVIRSGIKDAERDRTLAAFQSKNQELVSATVLSVDPDSGNATISMAGSEAILPRSEQVPGETLSEGQHIKVYVVGVREGDRGPKAMISRTHPGLVKRLFEMEVPEIFDGTIEVKAISREAGSRTKIAVWSKDSNVDAVGSCIGPRGTRVSNIREELGSEKIDIVKYSEIPEEYIAAALSPSEVVSVTMMEDGKSCRVIVPDSQLSLAIGKEGQNARLAAKLTGFKIDIKPESEG